MNEMQNTVQVYRNEQSMTSCVTLPIPDDVPVEHPKVQELRELVQWSEGQVWCSPERHGAMSAVFKAQIDWIPLALGAVRPPRARRSL